MFKRDYFLLAMREGLFKYKRWALEAFSITRNSGPHDYPYGLETLPDGRYAFGDPKAPEGLTVIDDAMPGEPLFRPLEKVYLNPGDLANVRKPVETCYGNALVNQIVLVHPFGNKIGYIAGPIKTKAVESLIVHRWDDHAKDDPSGDPDKRPIRTAEYRVFGAAMGQLPGLSQLCVPSATVRTMTADPAMIKRRDELLKEHKNELNDPVVIARIIDELTKMDRAWMKGDPGERFYIKDKAYDVVRLKVFIMQGISSGFGVQGDFIPTSLDEAWDITKLPAMVNQLRDGSFSRGAQTALGGVETKYNNRIFQNSVVAEADCGSHRGLEIHMTKDKVPHFVGNYQVVGDHSVVLTEETLIGLVGKTIRVRSPIYCRTTGANFCARCMGDKISRTPQALSTYSSNIGSIFLSNFLKKMHGASLKTVPLDLPSAFS